MNEKYLYLIEFNGLIKIGISKHPEKRIKQLNLGKNAKIIHTCKYPETRKIEEFIHDKYKSYQYSNEWFRLNEEQIEDIKNFEFEEWLEYGN